MSVNTIQLEPDAQMFLHPIIAVILGALVVATGIGILLVHLK